jgi:integrase
MAENPAATEEQTPSWRRGAWRSFPKVPNLFQYVNTGTYYARVKVGGKTIRRSLKTNVWSTARLRLHDFVQEVQEERDIQQRPTFGRALELFEKRLDSATNLKPQSKDYRRWCIKKLNETWPELRAMKLSDIPPAACREWAARLRKQVACHYFNNLVGTLKQVIEIGIKDHIAAGGERFENPALEVNRTKVLQKDLRLPEPHQFRELVKNIRDRKDAFGVHIANLVEFLAYSGMRVYSEAAWVRWEDLDWHRKEIVVRGDPATGTKGGDIRRIPMLPDMEQLLRSLKLEREAAGIPLEGKVMQVTSCREALAVACARIGIAKITPHDLRHLFATRCIEAGVDIPTVSRWLGHKDGGILAMKTYGHLRDEHSKAMAQKVRF